MGTGTYLIRIFAAFFRFGFKTRRNQLFWIFTLIPPLIWLVLLVLDLTTKGVDASTREFFFNLMLVYYFQLLLPVLAIFSGSSIVTDEVESRTLVYLTTSAAPKPAIFLGKYLAHTALLAILLVAGFSLTFGLTHFSLLGQTETWGKWLRYTAVLLLAFLAYSAAFSFLGTLMKKSVMLGFFFVFGWESVVQYFPGSTQKFTVIHYVKSLIPSLPHETKFLSFQLEPSSPTQAVATLLLIAILFLVAATILFQKKEFVLSDTVG